MLLNSRKGHMFKRKIEQILRNFRPLTSKHELITLLCDFSKILETAFHNHNISMIHLPCID